MVEKVHQKRWIWHGGIFHLLADGGKIPPYWWRFWTTFIGGICHYFSTICKQVEKFHQERWMWHGGIFPPPCWWWNFSTMLVEILDHLYRWNFPPFSTTVYDARKYCFSACIVNIWNSLPNDVVDVNNVNQFKAHVDKFWLHQDVKFDFTADLTGLGDRSVWVICDV